LELPHSVLLSLPPKLPIRWLCRHTRHSVLRMRLRSSAVLVLACLMPLVKVENVGSLEESKVMGAHHLRAVPFATFWILKHV